MVRVTIAQIAQEAGVSVPTVSKVLNGRRDVAAATREKVEAILSRTNYQRRSGKGGGPQTAGGMIELVMHSIETPWSLEIIQGVQQVAAMQNLGVVLTQLGGVHLPGREWIEGVFERNPIGVILVLSSLEEDQQRQLEARSIPFVVIDTFGELPKRIPTVGSNNWNGGYSATKHLIGLGHEHCAIISGPRDYLCSRARVDGYRSALDEAGLEFDPALVRWGDFDLSGGYQHGRELLSAANRPTAIFAGSDYQAFGVMKAARDLGLSVPEDVSIVGYDDIPMSQWLSPELTTVRQPLREMAAAATRILIDSGLAENAKSAPTRIDLSTELVIRESTAPPKSAARV